MSNNKRVTLSVFLIAFAFGLSITGIAPILGILKTEYATYGTDSVQILQTLHYLLLMVGSIFIGYLTTKFANKNIAIIGLLIIGVFGVLPAFIAGYNVVFISRLLIGFGFGITSPINTAIITEFFVPEKRPMYFGLHVIGMGFGNMIANLVGGVLAGINYKYFYLVYGIAFISLLGVKVLLPKEGKKVLVSKEDMKMNKEVYMISFASFLHTLFITAYSTNIAIYVAQKITENSAIVGTVTAVNAAFALIVGATFAGISKVLKKATLVVSTILAVLGYVAIISIPGLLGVYIGSAFCGASLSCFMARCSFMLSVSVKPEAAAKASGIFSIIGGVGGLVSPILIGRLSEVITHSNTSINQFMVSLFGMVLLTVFVYVISYKVDKNKI